jgi:hypothetical protein
VNVPVLWVISGARCTGALAVSAAGLGVAVPADVAALASCFWGRDAAVLVTTRDGGIPAGDCEVLYGTVTQEEAVMIETALAAMVS